MRLLDLFSGAGGSAMGYSRAGFADITGVDNRPMPRYPFRFVQADALEFLRGVKPGEYDMIHASPPCQAYTQARHLYKREHPDLVPAVRELLLKTETPYVIENVPGSPLVAPVMLCGLMFGLRVFRHRLFETSCFLMQVPHIGHRGKQIGQAGYVCVAGYGDSGRCRIANDHRHVEAWRRAMGIDWMTRDELAQAIPPQYTEAIGSWMLEQIS